MGKIIFSREWRAPQNIVMINLAEYKLTVNNSETHTKLICKFKENNENISRKYHNHKSQSSSGTKRKRVPEEGETNAKPQLSRLVTKPTKLPVCPRRLRSAWASAQSDQSLRCPHEEALGPLTTYWVHSSDTEQTGRMPRLIWVFAGCTCRFVCFVIQRLNLNVDTQVDGQQSFPLYM